MLFNDIIVAETLQMRWKLNTLKSGGQ